MATLSAVFYRLYDGEESAVEAAMSGEPHTFSGEIALSYVDSPSCYVSWVDVPTQFSIGLLDESHFKVDAPLNERDVSASRMWAPLIGQNVSLQYTAAENQMLRVASGDSAVLLCSFEGGHWGSDFVTVCRSPPTGSDT